MSRDYVPLNVSRHLWTNGVKEQKHLDVLRHKVKHTWTHKVNTVVGLSSHKMKYSCIFSHHDNLVPLPQPQLRSTHTGAQSTPTTARAHGVQIRVAAEGFDNSKCATSVLPNSWEETCTFGYKLTMGNL